MIKIWMESVTINDTKYGIVCILTILEWKFVMDDWNLDELSYGKWRSLQHCKSKMPKLFYKEWQPMLSIHLVLVILHRQFTISTEQDKQNWWH